LALKLACVAEESLAVTDYFVSYSVNLPADL